MRAHLRLSLLVFAVLSSNCASTGSRVVTAEAARGHDLVRLYVRRLADGTQAYEHSLATRGSQGYVSAEGRPELRAGSFYASATPAPGTVPVYRFEIASGDGAPIYYLSTSTETPPSFSNRQVQFHAFAAAREGTTPVHLYTLVGASGMQVYYYSTSTQTPPDFRDEGVVFHAFAEPPPVGAAAVASNEPQACHPVTHRCDEGICCDMANLGGINDPTPHPPRYRCVGGSTCPAALP